MIKVGIDFGVAALKLFTLEDLTLFVSLELFYNRKIAAVFDHAILEMKFLISKQIRTKNTDQKIWDIFKNTEQNFQK